MNGLTIQTAPASVSPFAGLDICLAIGLTVEPGRRGPVFEDDVWDFNVVLGLPAYLARPHKRWRFTEISNPLWRTVAKEYLLALMLPSHEAVRVLPGAWRVQRTIALCASLRYHVTGWFNWLTSNGVTSLGAVNDHHCQSYIAERRRGVDTDGNEIIDRKSVVNASAKVVSGLVQYRDLFSADRYHPQLRPFGGRAAAAVAGMKTPTENSTPVVAGEVLQPLLAAALYFIDTLSPHIIAMRDTTAAEREAVRDLPEVRNPGMGGLMRAINQHVEHRHPFDRSPVRALRENRIGIGDDSDPLYHLSLRALAREAGLGHFRPPWLEALRPALEAAVAAVGIEEHCGRDAAPVPRADGQGEVAWTVPLPERNARAMEDYLRAACMVVICAATGMRSSELFQLEVGCRLAPEQTGPGLLRHRIAGTVVKHRGNLGEADQWVVLPEVYQAIGVAEQLHRRAATATLLFGRVSFKNVYNSFRNWVNGPAGQRLGLAPIPEPAVELRMLRRTLAVELAYRPGGLLAAKLALKHISVVTTEGYASRPGGAQARFLADIGQEEQKRNITLLIEELGNLQLGIRPSGPHARELTEFFTTVDGKLTDEQRTAPNIILNDQELRSMLTKRAKTLHLGAANYCWFVDPAKALCLRLAGTPQADRPLIGMCDSARCPQATHHPCHRPVWEDNVRSTKVFLGKLSRGQNTERARLQAQLARAERVVAAIDAASGTGTPGGAGWDG